MTHWKRNSFSIPYGKAGRSFVNELTRLYQAFGSASAMESVALKAAIVLPILLLQKPSKKFKPKDHITCLERRLPLWLSGRLMDLVNERRALQERLPRTHRMSYKNSDNLARSFSNLMFDGKCKAALDLLSYDDKGGRLHLDDEVNMHKTVKDILINKHPPAQPIHPSCIVSEAPQDPHPW